jgi:hypothetical protein
MVGKNAALPLTARARTDASTTSHARLSASLRRAFDFIQRRRVFKRRRIAELFAEVPGADDAPHYLRVSRLWDVADKNDFFWRERFAKLVGERVF